MIDDNPADGETVRRLLESEAIPWPVDFDLCLEPRQASEQLKNNEADVLIVDYHFPFGTGFDLLEKLRNSGIETTAIMLTGQGSEDVAGQAVKVGLDDYLPKDKLNGKTLKQALERLFKSSDTGMLPPTRISQRRKEKNSPRSLVRLFSRLVQNFKKDSPAPLFFLGMKFPQSKNNISSVWPEIFAAAIKSLSTEATIYQVKELVFAGFGPDFSDELITFETLSTDLVERARRNDSIDLQDHEKPEKDFFINGLKMHYGSDFIDPSHLLNIGLDKLRVTMEENALETVKINRTDHEDSGDE